MNELQDVLNVGVPCYESLILPLYDMTLSCAKRKFITIDKERDMRRELSSRIQSITGARSLNKGADCLMFINLVTDNNSYSKLGIDEKQRIVNCFRNLVFLDRNQDVASLMTNARYKLKDLNYFVKNLGNNKQNYSFLLSRFPNIVLGGRYPNDFINYINNEFSFYKEVYLHMKDILDLDLTNLFTLYADSLEPSKVGMFIAYQYLLTIEEDIRNNNFLNIQKYLFYLSAYLKNNANRKVVIIINNTVINYSYIENLYKNILRNYSSLKEIVWDRDVFLDKERHDNEAVIDSLLNMKTIKTNEEFIKSGKGEATGVSKGKVKRVPTLEELEEIRKYLEYRMYIYLKNKPLAQIVCDNNFSNYKAFLFDNGIIAADRFYKINTASEMKKDAIYVFDALNFPKKILASKQELIGNTPRIFHVKGWEDQIEELVSRDTSDELKTAASYLTKLKRV